MSDHNLDTEIRSTSAPPLLSAKTLLPFRRADIPRNSRSEDFGQKLPATHFPSKCSLRTPQKQRSLTRRWDAELSLLWLLSRQYDSGIRHVSKHLGLSRPHLSNLLSGKRALSEKLRSRIRLSVLPRSASDITRIHPLTKTLVSPEGVDSERERDFLFQEYRRLLDMSDETQTAPRLLGTRLDGLTLRGELPPGSSLDLAQRKGEWIRTGLVVGSADQRRLSVERAHPRSHQSHYTHNLNIKDRTKRVLAQLSWGQRNHARRFRVELKGECCRTQRAFQVLRALGIRGVRNTIRMDLDIAFDTDAPTWALRVVDRRKRTRKSSFFAERDVRGCEIGNIGLGARNAKVSLVAYDKPRQAEKSRHACSFPEGTKTRLELRLRQLSIDELRTRTAKDSRKFAIMDVRHSHAALSGVDHFLVAATAAFPFCYPIKSSYDSSRPDDLLGRLRFRAIQESVLRNRRLDDEDKARAALSALRGHYQELVESHALDLGFNSEAEALIERNVLQLLNEVVDSGTVPAPRMNEA